MNSLHTKLFRVLDLEFYHPHHLDLSSGHPRVTKLPSMKEIPTTPPTPNVLLAQDFRLDNQTVPHTRSWRPLATAVNYLFRIVPIVYIAFQAWPASPVGVQSDSGMGCTTTECDDVLVVFSSLIFSSDAASVTR
ncbi:hypothetical protein DSO57_1014839 [Entomophthora muscae]|uniref:Uncharacterized protein n=1 Tax=Entomophthora muscae TaxID=34485 RepID=A0ACC2S752_9FUNG|nr:hypothetical protein DSO57_1014839 [Entomophthora muscae]